MKTPEQFGATEISLVEFPNLKEEDVVDHEIRVTEGFGHHIRPEHKIKELLEILRFFDSSGGLETVRREVQIGDFEQIFREYYARFIESFAVETELYFDKVISGNFHSRIWYNLHLHAVVNSMLRMIQYGKEVAIGKY